MRRFITAFLGLVLFLGTLEGILRLAFPIQLIRVSTEKKAGELGWGPDLAEDCESLPLHLGKSSQYRVLAIGDSILNCWSKEDAEEKVAGALRRRLSPAQIEVLNLSSGGWGTDQELLAYREIGRKYSPNLVLLFFTSVNDVANNVSKIGSGFGGQTAPKPHFEITADNHLNLLPAETSIEAPSFWSPLARTQIGLRLAARLPPNKAIYQSHLPYENAGVFATPPPEWVEPGWKMTRLLLKQFKDDVEKDGAKFAIVYVPNGVHSPDAGCKDRRCIGYFQSRPTVECAAGKLDVLRPYERLKTITQDLNISLIDNIDEMYSFGGSHQKVVSDCLHLTKMGSEMLAQRVSQFVTNALSHQL